MNIMICILKVIHWFLLMFLKNFRIFFLKKTHLDSVKFLSNPGLASQGALKKTKLRLELIYDIEMLLMVHKGIREGICHGIHAYPKDNNKCMKDCNQNKESSYLKYWDVNNSYGEFLTDLSVITDIGDFLLQIKYCLKF